jgi:hypothetical protein
MSGPGDIDGEVSGDEAAWRDLIARFDVPADRTSTEVPWPAREDLPDAAISLAEPGGGSAETSVSTTETSAMTADTADGQADLSDAPAESRGSQTAPPGGAADGATDPAARADHPANPVTSFYLPGDRMRVIRPAGDPRSYTPPEEADQPYVPVPLPPPAKLDSVSKAAIVGVIGGPGYLLIASIFLHWTISAEEALVAVAAFVGGFMTLVIKLGDRSSRDDDDDGAVL